MGNVKSLSHSKWEYIYHITWIPEYRKKKIYKELRKYLGEVFKELARQKECEVMSNGGVSQVGPCSYDDVNSSEICSGTSYWFHKRQKCYSNSKKFRWS